jgi:hypothetical protein
MNTEQKILETTIDTYTDNKLKEKSFSFDPPAYPNRKWTSPSFIYAPLCQGQDRKHIRALVKQVPQMEFFEACARGEITSSQAAELLMIRKESDNVLVRFLKRII